MNKFFNKLASAVANKAGSWQAFLAAMSLVVGWAIVGPAFGYSQGWQLFINTGTTITTFLMVFLIQNEQNRNDEALQLKLDELIIALSEADDKFVGIEDLTDEDRDTLRDHINTRKEAGLSED